MESMTQEHFLWLRDEMSASYIQRGAEMPNLPFTTVAYDWENAHFFEELEKVKNEFFKHHPELENDKKFDELSPAKIKGMEILEKLCILNRIHPDEYLILFKEILHS